MEKEIIIKIGGFYSMMERRQQVLVMIPDKPPMVLSHDTDIAKAIDNAFTYIKNNFVPVAKPNFVEVTTNLTQTAEDYEANMRFDEARDEDLLDQENINP